MEITFFKLIKGLSVGNCICFSDSDTDVTQIFPTVMQ